MIDTKLLTLSLRDDVGCNGDYESPAKRKVNLRSRPSGNCAHALRALKVENVVVVQVRHWKCKQLMRRPWVLRRLANTINP